MDKEILELFDKPSKWYIILWEDITNNLYYYFRMKPRDWYFNIKWGIKNYILFSKQIWNWRPWDGRFQEDLFAFGLEQVKKAIENGNEERASANKKIKALEEVIFQIRRDIDDEIKFDREHETLDEYSKRYHTARIERYDTIAKLIKGQDPFEYKDNDGYDYDSYVEWFDGSGIEGWWD